METFPSIQLKNSQSSSVPSLHWKRDRRTLCYWLMSIFLLHCNAITDRSLSHPPNVSHTGVTIVSYLDTASTTSIATLLHLSIATLVGCAHSQHRCWRSGNQRSTLPTILILEVLLMRHRHRPSTYLTASLHCFIAPSIHLSIAPVLHCSSAPSLHCFIAPVLHLSIALSDNNIRSDDNNYRMSRFCK